MTRAMDHGSREQLFRVLQDQNRVTAELSAALDLERNLIAARDDAGLEQAVRDKAALIARLESLEAERLRIVQVVAGSEATDSDFEVLARELDTQGEMLKLWRSLGELALACREKNLANGNLITLSLQAVGEALSILRGGEPGAALYDPLGRTVAEGDSRSLAKA